MPQRRIRWQWMSLALGLSLVASGCAPTAQEWAAVDALPDGPVKAARRAELTSREAAEQRWWELAGWAGSLAGGFLPGAGLAVAALHRARRAQRERDHHAAAARTLTGNVDQALAQLSDDRRRMVLEQIKQSQVASGQRETIRAYLRPAAVAMPTETQP